MSIPPGPGEVLFFREFFLTTVYLKHERVFMNKIIISILCITSFIFSVLAEEDRKAPYHPQVSIMTSKGEIVVELKPEKAPKTVENFLGYVESGFYENTIFHRVIKEFMIQGGGFTTDMLKKKARPPIQNEADNRASNRKYTIAMARTPDPHSASAQFFIKCKNNDFLDFKNKSPQGWGYCVFGRVIKGMAVVDAIEGVATAGKAGMQDVPVKTVLITKVKLLNPQK
jgi:cyclophilin family peptidyl-prolyl cis-trans isomerase